MGFFSQAFLVFLMKESKKRRQKQPGKLMAKSRSQPVNLPGARPLMNPLLHNNCLTGKQWETHCIHVCTCRDGGAYFELGSLTSECQRCFLVGGLEIFVKYHFYIFFACK